MATPGQEPLAQNTAERRSAGFLTFAAWSHLLWAALLLPYAVTAALVLGGQAMAQDLVDGLARSFLLVPVFVIGTLAINLALAALVVSLRDRATQRGKRGGLAIETGVFALVWFLAAQLLVVNGFGDELAIDSIAILAAAAGAAYGFILALSRDAVR